MAILVLAITLFLFTKMWKFACGCLLMFALSFFTLGTPQPAYRMTLNAPSGLIKTEARRKGEVISTTQISRPEISSSNMEFNRGDTRIVIVRHDGSLYYPLGKDYIQNAPDEYIALNAIQQMIGQVPESGRSQ